MADARTSDRSKRSPKYSVSVLFTVSSTPKHAAYCAASSHEAALEYPLIAASSGFTRSFAPSRTSAA